jgi:hypothetical protein
MEQIRVYNLPTSDISNDNFSIIITDSVASDNGQDIAAFMRNRDLTSSWITTGSNDSAGTIVEGVIADSTITQDIFIVGHNLKDFNVEYWDGVAWGMIESITNNTETTSHIIVNNGDGINTGKIRIVIFGTMTPDADKRITRLMFASRLESGAFISWPIIRRPMHGVIKKDSKMLSGKHFISESTGAFSVTLSWKGVTEQADVDIIEKMTLGRKPTMIWINGGDEFQFRFKTIGYRKQDFYIVKPSKDYINEFYKGIYQNMIPLSMPLVEVV